MSYIRFRIETNLNPKHFLLLSMVNLEKGLTNIVLFFTHALPSEKWPTILGEKAALGFAVFVSGEVLPGESRELARTELFLPI